MNDKNSYDDSFRKTRKQIMTHENFYDQYYERKLAGSRLSALFKVSEYLIRYNVINILRQYSPVPIPRIIDIGCGRGHLTGLLGRFGEVIGTDASYVAVNYCKKRYPGIEFMLLDVFDTGWFESHKEQFDVVISTEVIEHLPSERHREYLSNLRSLLKVQGIMIITTPDRTTVDMMNRDSTMSDNEFYIRYEGQQTANLLDKSKLQSMLEDKNELILHEMISPFISNRVVELFVKLIAMPTGYVLLQWIQKILTLPGKRQILCLRKE